MRAGEHEVFRFVLVRGNGIQLWMAATLKPCFSPGTLYSWTTFIWCYLFWLFSCFPAAHYCILKCSRLLCHYSAAFVKAVTFWEPCAKPKKANSEFKRIHIYFWSWTWIFLQMCKHRRLLMWLDELGPNNVQLGYFTCCQTTGWINKRSTWCLSKLLLISQWSQTFPQSTNCFCSLEQKNLNTKSLDELIIVLLVRIIF